VGEVEENMQKNRSHEVIPYDRNRVSMKTFYINKLQIDYIQYPF